MFEASAEFESNSCAPLPPTPQQIELTHKTGVLNTDPSLVCQKEATAHFMKALLRLPKGLDSNWRMEKETTLIR